MTNGCKANGYATQSVLRNHLLGRHFTDNSTKPPKGFWPVKFACNRCKVFRSSTKNGLKQHRKLYCGKTENIPCTISGCEYWFNEKRKLSIHLLQHKKMNKTTEKNKRKSVFYCPNCRSKFTSRLAFNAHDGNLPDWAIPSPVNRPVISCEERQRRRALKKTRNCQGEETIEEMPFIDTSDQTEQPIQFNDLVIENEDMRREMEEFLKTQPCEFIDSELIKVNESMEESFAETFNAEITIPQEEEAIEEEHDLPMSIFFAIRSP